jgi:hypothetical protein
MIMNKNLNHLLDSKYYLYNCNLQRDIENNVGEIEIPEFTMEHINNIDKKYMHIVHGPIVDKAHACKIYNYNINDNEFNEEYRYSNYEMVKKMNDSFELTELYIEHVDNIAKLQDKINEYTSITEKTNKIRMYFQDIIPIIQNDDENLKTVLDILSNTN